MATGSHVVMAAVQARAVAVGRRGVEWGGVCRWQTINRAYGEPAAESLSLMAPRQTSGHTRFGLCF